MTIISELETVRKLPEACSQIVVSCLYVVCSGRPDFLWSVTYVARATVRWYKARGKRLARLISHSLYSIATKEEFTTPDPTMIYQSTHEAEKL